MVSQVELHDARRAHKAAVRQDKIVDQVTQTKLLKREYWQCRYCRAIFQNRYDETQDNRHHTGQKCTEAQLQYWAWLKKEEKDLPINKQMWFQNINESKQPNSPSKYLIDLSYHQPWILKTNILKIITLQHCSRLQNGSSQDTRTAEGLLTEARSNRSHWLLTLITTTSRTWLVWVGLQTCRRASQRFSSTRLLDFHLQYGPLYSKTSETKRHRPKTHMSFWSPTIDDGLCGLDFWFMHSPLSNRSKREGHPSMEKGIADVILSLINFIFCAKICQSAL